MKGLKGAAANNGILVSDEIRMVEEGWEGKPKGFFQILWQRGFIDGEHIAKITKRQHNKRHKRLLRDFEIVWFENIAPDSPDVNLYRFWRWGDNSANHGTSSDCTPKCHPELSGEGIEYTWARCKSHFRNILLDRKRGRENFKVCVSESLSWEISATALVRKFSKRVRRYMQGYHVLNQIYQGLIETSDKEWQTNGNANRAIIPMRLEQMVKKFKTHRCAMDFDRAFCKALFKEA